MMTNVATGQAFTNWLDIYDNAGKTNKDIDETDTRTFSILTDGEIDDPDMVMEMLINFPFLAAFFACKASSFRSIASSSSSVSASNGGEVGVAVFTGGAGGAGAA